MMKSISSGRRLFVLMAGIALSFGSVQSTSVWRRARHHVILIRRRTAPTRGGSQLTKRSRAAPAPGRCALHGTELNAMPAIRRRDGDQN